MTTKTTVTDPVSKQSPGSQTSTSTASKKVTKMRPGGVRNGRKVLFDRVQVTLSLSFLILRNLCAHRWLKAFKDTTNGNTAEFKQYYDSLTEEQRKVLSLIIIYFTL